MLDRSAIEEQHFGILTDDGLALEATLVRPTGQADDEVRAVHLWVPKFPFTKSSVLPAARREAAVGARHRTVQLTLDLRGTGESDGMPTVEGFEIDIRSAYEWAKERFGPHVDFQRSGFPDLGAADRLVALPLRPGVVVELYRYNPDSESKAYVLYLSSYGSFERADDALCRAVADDGYTVYGGDLMRYLLMAGPLSVESLWTDGTALVAQLDQPLFLIARAFAAGPALLLAAGVPAISGILVTGPAQEGLAQDHLFSEEDPARLVLGRYIKKLAKRPALFLWNRAEAGKFRSDSLRKICNLAERPRLWGVVPRIDPPVLLNALGWLGQNRPTEQERAP